MFKTWFQTFKTALTQPKEYKNLSQRSFWSGYWYLFLLVLIGIFLKTLVFASGMVVAVPFVKSQLPMVKNQITGRAVPKLQDRLSPYKNEPRVSLKK